MSQSDRFKGLAACQTGVEIGHHCIRRGRVVVCQLWVSESGGMKT